jgi:hypothetical protein
MTSEVDVANRALALVGTRSQIASLDENSNEARSVKLVFHAQRDELLRMAPWNCATNFTPLALLAAAPGTPENPTAGADVWMKGVPPPPWSYEYAYPNDCLRPIYVVPQFTTGFTSGVPITTAVTGGAPAFWNGPPVRFKVGIDQINIVTGKPSTDGVDQRVILTNQEQAILAYIKRVTNPDVWDDLFTNAFVNTLASRLVISLTGDRGLAQLQVQLANQTITQARVMDGNEGLTVNDVTPDWIRTRGISYQAWEFSPNIMFDWGPMLSMY